MASSDKKLVQDHQEKSFSVFGIESGNLHLSALIGPSALRAYAAIFISTGLMYILSKPGQVRAGIGATMAVIALALIFHYSRDGKSRDSTLMLSGILSSSIISAVALVLPDWLDTVLRLVGIAWTAGWLIIFAREDVAKNLIGHRPAPLVSLTLAAVGFFITAWPVTVFAMILGLLLLSILILALAVLRHCLDTGNQDIDMQGAGTSVKRWLKGRRISKSDREALHQSLFFEGRGTRIEIDRFLLFMGLASVIAVVAIISESPAVVIGAMLIAPLMTPLMSITISLLMGWPKRLSQATIITLSGVALAVVVSALVSLMIPGNINIHTNSETLPRIAPTLFDLWVAMAAGAAGALALSRQDRFTSISGVAVSIALVPPLAVTGIALQQAQWAAAYGSFLLFLTNAVAIVLVGGLVFVLSGVVPVAKLARSQSRMGVAIFALQVAVMLVFAGLMINGQTASVSLIRQEQARGAVSQWLEDRDDVQVESIKLDDEVLTLHLSGPGEKPRMQSLGNIIEDEMGSGLLIEMTWTPSEKELYRVR